MRFMLRPMLVSGMLADTPCDGPIVLIDSEQSQAEQAVAVFHELLHSIGMEDEHQVEGLAVRLGKACPDIVAHLAQSGLLLPQPGGSKDG
jgi:hypothetical protein